MVSILYFSETVLPSRVERGEPTELFLSDFEHSEKRELSGVLNKKYDFNNQQKNMRGRGSEVELRAWQKLNVLSGLVITTFDKELI